MFRAAARDVRDARDASTDLSIDGQQRDRQFSLGAVSSNTNRVRKRQSRQSAFHRGESTVHDSCISYLGPAARPRDRPRFPVCARSEPIDENAHFARNVRSPPQPSCSKTAQLRSTERWDERDDLRISLSRRPSETTTEREAPARLSRGSASLTPRVLASARIFPLSSSTNVSCTFTFISIMVNTCHCRCGPPGALALACQETGTAPPPPADRRSRLTSFTTASFIFAIVSALPTAR